MPPPSPLRTARTVEEVAAEPSQGSSASLVSLTESRKSQPPRGFAAGVSLDHKMGMLNYDQPPDYNVRGRCQ